MDNIKTQSFDLQMNVNTGAYDPAKTNVRGLFGQRAFQGSTVISIPITKWYDFFTLSGETILHDVVTANGRIFSCTAVSTGLVRVVYGTWNESLGEYVYIGKVILPLPFFTTNVPTAQTIREMRVDDSNTSDIKVQFYVIPTGAGQTQHSGYLRTHKLTLADFVPNPASPTIPFGTGDDQKAMYYDQNPSAQGILNTSAFELSPVGFGIDTTTKRAYCLMGTAAAYWIYVRDYSAVPTWVSASCTFTLGTPGKVNYTSHPFTDLDVIIFPSGTGLPTGLVANTPYHVRNKTANDFELSSVYNGASIAFTVSSGTATIGRAFGNTTSGWLNIATATPGTAITGTLLLIQNGRVVTLGTGHAALNGQKCLVFGSSTRVVAIPITDIVNGATNFPNLLQVDLLGAINQTVTPTAVNFDWSEQFDMAVFTTSTTKVIGKKMQNGIIGGVFGVLNNDYLEGKNYINTPNLVTQFGAVAINGIAFRNKWLHLIGSTVGQRGQISAPVGADYTLGTDYVITKVLNIESALAFVGVALSAKDNAETSDSVLWFRTNLVCDFSDETTGWTMLPDTLLMDAYSATGVNQIQFKIASRCIDPLTSNPSQIIDVFFAYIPLQQVAKDWLGWVGQTSQDGVSPAYSAYQVGKTLSSAVAMRFMAIDKVTKVVIALADTDTDFASFDKTSNSGTSWSAMTGANDYPLTQFTSGVRYKWGGAVPSDVVISWMVK